jgi:flagellar biosynthesis/type III secretory pathway ATPase
VSRLASQLATAPQKDADRRLREALSAYRDAEDLIQLGAYVAGSNPVLDASIQLRPELLSFLRQDREANSTFPETLAQMQQLAMRLQSGGAPARLAQAK